MQKYKDFMEESFEMHAIVRGNVQGVGFRATVRHHALEVGLTGTVSNLFDGSVEIYALGTKSKLELLLSRLQRDSGLGSIESIKSDFQPSTKNYEHFKIVHSYR
jgi:acylphosphatase